MSELLGQEPEYRVTVLYGHVEVRAWFEFDGEKLIGMGSKKTYDQDGKLIDYSESPTGLVMTLPNAKGKRRRCLPSA